MPQWVSENYLEPGSGLVNGRRPHLLSPRQWNFMQNWKPFAGNLVKRGGCVTQGSSLGATSIPWLMHAYGNDTTAALVVRMAAVSTKMRYRVGSGAWTDFQTGLTAGKFWNAVSYKGNVYACNGTDTPQEITIANPPVPVGGGWITMPSGINPTWVVLHRNSLYIGGDLSTPQMVYFSDPGDPNTFQTTNFYQVPDNQNGNFPKIAVNCFDGIALICQDFIDYLTGTGANSHRIFPFPRGAACIAYRSVVDMGKYGCFYLTEDGVYTFDGHSDPEPLDAFNAVNFSDIDLTTETDTWAVRVGNEYRLYFKSKGNLLTSVATAASILASSTARWRYATIAHALTRKTIIPFVAGGTTDSYYSYDAKLKIWSGPHTGTHLSGAWTQYRYGDTQDLWVGDATTGGLVSMADQQSAYTDNGNIYECILKTGAIGNSLSRIQIQKIVASLGVQDSDEAKMRIAVWQNGDMIEPPACEMFPLLNRNSSPGGANQYNPPMGWQDFVIASEVPDYKGKNEGFMPQIEFRLASQEGAEFRMFTADYEEV